MAQGEPAAEGKSRVNWDIVFHAATVTITLVSIVISIALWVRGNDLSNIDQKFRAVDNAIAKEAKIAADRDDMMRNERYIQITNLDQRLSRIENAQEDILRAITVGWSKR